MRRWLILLAALSCCGPRSTTLQYVHLSTRPNEDKAIDLVWSVYSDYASEPSGLRVAPMVEWIDGDAFDCAGSTSVQWCKGEYIRRIHLARVAWPKRNVKFSRVALAHELCHAYFGGDHDLCNDDLPPVETANARLRDLGM